MGARLRNAASFLAVLGAEAAALAALHRAGGWLPGAAVDWGDLGAWLADVAPEDAVVAAVRAAGLAVGWWLLATTVLYAAARAARLPGLVRGVGWATLPALRRVVDGALATSVVAASTFGGGANVAFAGVGGNPVVVRIEAPPGAAGSAPAGYRPRPAGGEAPTDSPGYRPTPAGGEAAGGDPEVPGDLEDAAPADPEVPGSGEGAEAPGDPAAAPGPEEEFPSPAPAGPPTTPGHCPAPTGEAPPARPAAPPAGAVTYTVRRGDNFWRIAARRVAAEAGRPVAQLGEDEVRAYWLRLVRANEGRLASGDADLVYPGEELALPALFEHRQR